MNLINLYKSQVSDVEVKMCMLGHGRSEINEIRKATLWNSDSAVDNLVSRCWVEVPSNKPTWKGGGKDSFNFFWIICKYINNFQVE